MLFADLPLAVILRESGESRNIQDAKRLDLRIREGDKGAGLRARRKISFRAGSVSDGLSIILLHLLMLPSLALQAYKIRRFGDCCCFADRPLAVILRESGESRNIQDAKRLDLRIREGDKGAGLRARRK